MPFERLIPSLQRGEVDILMAGLTVFSQRRTFVDFADPYLESRQGLLAPASSGATFTDPRILTLVPYRIGVQQGTVGHQVAQRIRADSTVVPYSTAQKAANALRAGKVDVVLHDAPVLWYIAAQNPAAGYGVASLVTQENLAWAVRRGDANLRSQANAALAKWKKNGTHKRIIRAYLPRYGM